MFKTSRAIVLTCITLVLTLALPAQAATEDGRWSLRFGASAAEPDGTFEDQSDSIFLSTEASTAYGAAFSAEFRLTKFVGLEMGTMAFAEDDVTIRVDINDVNDERTLFRSDRLGFQPLFVGLNFHLAPTRKADVYFGPFVSYVRYQAFGVSLGSDTNELSDLFPDTIEIDSDWAFGAVLGVDIPFPDGRWFFNANARYLKTSLEAGTASVDYDPLIATIGFGLRLGGQR